MQATTDYVYAYGRIRARFRSLSDEHEFFHEAVEDPENPRELAYLDVGNDAQLEALYLRGDYDSLLYAVLVRPENLYLAREMVWVVEDLLGSQRIVLVPESDEQIMQLVELLVRDGRDETAGQLLVIGRALGMASSHRGLPMVVPLRIAAPSMATLIRDVRTKANNVDVRDSDITALFANYANLTANSGEGPDQRARNHVVLASDDLYARAVQLGSRDAKQVFELVEIACRTPASVDRSLVDVVVAFQGVDSGVVRRWVTTVDVEGPFPFFRGALRPYVDTLSA